MEDPVLCMAGWRKMCAQRQQGDAMQAWVAWDAEMRCRCSEQRRQAFNDNKLHSLHTSMFALC